MSRFASKTTASATAPYSIGANPKPVLTHQGGHGFAPSSPELELFNSCVSGFLADQFYESGDARVERVRELVGRCDPAWLAGFAPWLRHEAGMRSAPIVVAAEYAGAGFPNSRKVVASVLARADEPAELLAYWHGRFGRSVKSAVKRGIADAIVGGLYNERSALRYDSGPWRFGDVIEVVHPDPVSDQQSTLFKWLLDRRRHPQEAPPAALKTVARVRRFDATPVSQRQAVLKRGIPDGVSWERLAGWLPGGMDQRAWEAVIPQMGYLALLRNLNNFDRNGVKRGPVRSRLVDGQAIARSRVLPFRFLTAYKSLETDNYRVALATAADLAMHNLPTFPGSTLIMVDCSGSMGDSVGSGRSRQPLRLSELAGFTAEAIARRCDDARIVCYSESVLSTEVPARHVPLLKAGASSRYQPRGGTRTWSSTEAAYDQYPAQRVVIITDEQAGYGERDTGAVKVPVITWNVAGYRPHQAAHGSSNRFFVAGVSDTVMSTLPSIIGLGGTGRWPWETT